MQARHKTILGFLALLALALSIPSAPALTAVAITGPFIPPLQANAGPTVTLRAASGRTIHYRTQNGQTLDGIAPTAEDILHLVLHRNGALTEAQERTLLIDVRDIDVPPAGVSIGLRLETQHDNPTTPARTASG